MSNQLPIIDISALINDTELKDNVCQQINKALRDSGFFYIINHGISETVLQKFESLCRQFFAQPLEEKLKVQKTVGSNFGFFDVGEAKSNGKINIMEGINFAPELLSEKNQNRYPNIPEFRETIQCFLSEMVALGHKLIEGISLSLNLDKHYLAERYTGHEPHASVRVLNYPPVSDVDQNGRWGIAEHTDWGFLTILKQDNVGGLQVKTKSGWIDAPPVDHSFVCNIGDALQIVTGGLYKSTWHRVKSPTHCNRVSFPFFFHPNFNSQIKAIDGIEALIDENGNDDSFNEYDAFSGTFGDYMAMKIKKAHPKYN